MTDYGYRISEPGEDVKTCSDLKCVVTSKYPLLKGGLQGSGNISDSGYENASGTIEIEHNLGYIPVVRVFMDNGDEFIEIPHVVWQAGFYIFDTSYKHTTVNKITITASLWISGETATIDQDYKYYISNEKVNI